jgi:ADP-ribose pyrophosphatase
VSSRTEYFALADERPELFSNPPGACFEILLDEEEIGQVEAHMEKTLTDSGEAAESARVGIAYRDQYLMIVRDAVRFADGSVGTYIRICNRHPDLLGVAILPIWEGKILLIRHFRHATRSWHLEIPRGFGVVADSAESARHELREEIGAAASRLVELGEMYPDTGASSDRVALFLAEVETYGEADKKEAIAEILPTSVPQFERMVGTGELADGFLLAAYARAKTRGLI